MDKVFIFFIGICLFLTSPAAGFVLDAEHEGEDGEDTSRVTEKDIPQRTDWYWLLTMSYAFSNSYSDFINDEIDLIETNLGSLNESMIGVSMSFYWHIWKDPCLLLGFTLMPFDIHTFYFNSEPQLNVISSIGLLTASGMFFFKEKPGDGFFISYDLGLAPYLTFSNTYSSLEGRRTGPFGYSFGAGYGFFFTDAMLMGPYDAMLISIKYSTISPKGENLSSTSFVLSFLL